MPVKSKKWLVVLLVMVSPPAVISAPTDPSCSRVADCAMSLSPDGRVPIVSKITQTTEPIDLHLAAVAAEFLKPPAGFMDAAASPATGPKSLPAVPGALFMVLMGFLCVSLVKDHKVWFAALAGLLWVGQTGVQALPQLAMRLSHRSHSGQQLYPELTYPDYLESYRLRSDIEGTQYIGLLRHLEGIPERKERPHVKRGAKYLAPPLRRGFRQLKTTQFAITRLSSPLIPATKCLAAKVEQFICFSPAFIFENLPRGPPMPESESSSLLF